MRKILPLLLLVLLQSQTVQAQSLKRFLTSCAWGTLGGAGIGVVSLAVEDKPSQSWNNVARGASLGLYAGIAYGVFSMNKEPEMSQHPDFAIAPTFEKGQIDGAKVFATVLNF